MSTKSLINLCSLSILSKGGAFTMEQGIRYYRKKKGMTQKKLATLIGITPQSLSLYENGARKIPLEVLKSISKKFDVPTVELSVMKLTKEEILDSIAEIALTEAYGEGPVTDITGETYTFWDSFISYCDIKGIDTDDYFNSDEEFDSPRNKVFLRKNLPFLFTDLFIEKLKSANAISAATNLGTKVFAEYLDEEKTLILSCLEVDNHYTDELKRKETSLYRKFSNMRLDELQFKIEMALNKNDIVEANKLIKLNISKLSEFQKRISN
ncbi:XRE family transcriptional regulator [Levilactobacillus brevis]|nr:XRE family transcriptional regulator [Levilactobacillus brevis]